jgi:membrane protease YdiL (CAAX protease family)
VFPAPNQRQQRWGMYCVLFVFFLLTPILNKVGEVFSLPFWVLDCMASVFSAGILAGIMGSFLWLNLKCAAQKPVQIGVFALVGTAALWLFQTVFSLIFPQHLNLNDLSVMVNLAQSGFWGILTTALLTPIFEELLLRGLLFRGLYDRSPIAAWVICCALFPVLHILSYWSYYDILTGLLTFVQYLPAGVVLCLAYRKTGTLLTPIIIHCVFNFLSILLGGFLWH